MIRETHGELSRGEALERNARVEKRSGSATGAQRTGQGAKLSYSGNLLVENRNGLIVDSRVWEARDGRSAMRRWRCWRSFREAGG